MLAGIIARPAATSAYKLRRNVFRRVRAEAVAVLLAQYFATNALATHIFPQGDELHLRRHDPDAHSEAA